MNATIATEFTQLSDKDKPKAVLLARLILLIRLVGEVFFVFSLGMLCIITFGLFSSILIMLGAISIIFRLRKHAVDKLKEFDSK